MAARCSAAFARRLSPSSLGYSDVEMDVAAHRVRRGGQPIALGPTGIPASSAFPENPGRVFSRERLLDSVWSHDPDIDVCGPSTFMSAGCARRSMTAAAGTLSGPSAQQAYSLDAEA